MKKKIYKVVWDRNTLDEFIDILTFLEKQSRATPKIVKIAVLEKIAAIKKNPSICEVDKLKYPTDVAFRAFIVFSYRVTYQVKDEISEIRILRIRHTSSEPLGY